MVQKFIRPKVLFVANLDTFLYKLRLSFANKLREKNIEVMAVCPPGKDIKKIQKKGYQVILWNLKRESLNPIQEFKSILELVKIYKKEQPLAVHHFTTKPNVYGPIAARLARIPYIINTWTGLGFLFSNEKKAKIVQKVVFHLMKMLKKNIFAIFLNKHDLNFFMKHNLVEKSKATIIYEGVNTKKFHPFLRAKRKNKKLNVLFAARLIKEKGIEEFVEAAKLLKKEKINANFLIAGNIDPGNPNSISLKQLKEWEKEGAVKWIGDYPYERMPFLLNKVSVVVLPTYYLEGTPRILLEAAACGLPLIATNIEANKAIIKNGVNGYLIPPKDPIKLSKAIKKLLKNEKLRIKMGKNSRKIVIKKFDEELIVQKYISFYKKIGIIK
ncbi:MAG: glycosyltransferase family 4 protein [Candidatus Pacearchaeota archaeon]